MAERETSTVAPREAFPLRSRTGGVLVRSGQTEGSVDLARLAGLKPAGVICEVMNPDGTMSRLPELRKLCKEKGVKSHLDAAALKECKGEAYLKGFYACCAPGREEAKACQSRSILLWSPSCSYPRVTNLFIN